MEQNESLLKNMVGGATLLGQIAENIEQVLWLSDSRSGCILYASPAFEKVWAFPSKAFMLTPRS